MRRFRWELLFTGQEVGPDVDDILGKVDDKVDGVWEATDEGIIIRVRLR